MANKNEAKVTFKAETDAFTDGIKAINTSIGAMNAQLKLNSAQLDGTSSDTEALRSNMKLLADAQASAGQKVELTRMKLESACAIFGENSVEADRLRKSLALAELQEANLGKKLDAASAALDAQESAIRQLSGTISQQEGELEGLKRSYTNVVLEQGVRVADVEPAIRAVLDDFMQPEEIFALPERPFFHFKTNRIGLASQLLEEQANAGRKRAVNE